MKVRWRLRGYLGGGGGFSVNEDILCEAPGPGGRTCTLPYGHEPADLHAFDVELPHDLGDLLEHIMTEAENARVEYIKARRRQRIAFYCWCGMFAVYFGLAMWSLVR